MIQKNDMAQEVTNFARFYGILKKSYSFATKELGEVFKEEVVSQFSGGRTTSLREMTNLKGSPPNCSVPSAMSFVGTAACV